MGAFARGDVVLVPFPFSTGAGEKRRPAVVLADVPYGAYTDYIPCAISSHGAEDTYSIPIQPSEVIGGALTRPSVIRPTYIVSTSETRIIRRIGVLAPERLNDAVQVIRELFQ